MNDTAHSAPWLASAPPPGTQKSIRRRRRGRWRTIDAPGGPWFALTAPKRRIMPGRTREKRGGAAARRRWQRANADQARVESTRGAGRSAGADGAKCSAAPLARLIRLRLRARLRRRAIVNLAYCLVIKEFDGVSVLPNRRTAFYGWVKTGSSFPRAVVCSCHAAAGTGPAGSLPGEGKGIGRW